MILKYSLKFYNLKDEIIKEKRNRQCILRKHRSEGPSISTKWNVDLSSVLLGFNIPNA
jgi:hypothetical protein